MNLELANYLEQEVCWPQEGRHLLAQYNEESVVVYQAYKASIGLYAAENNYFGKDFSYTRMSWIKTNFLWMMYRSGWGTKEGQEVTLAIRLKREYFDQILEHAYPSSNILGIPQDEWKRKLQGTNVRLQWDPDHDPKGKPTVRKAIQLGLRDDFLLPFKGEGIIEISDISDFVREQKIHADSGNYEALVTPLESKYEVSDLARMAIRSN